MSLGGMLNLAGGGGQKPKPKPKKNTIAQKASEKNAARSAAALTGLSSTNPIAKQKQESADLGTILKKAAGVLPVAPAKTKKQQVSDQEDSQFKAFQQSIGVKNPPARPSRTQVEQRTKGSLPWVMKQLDSDPALKMTPEQRETVANVLRYRQLRDLGDGQFDPDIKVNVFDPANVKGKVRNEDVLDVLRLLKKNPAALEMELAGHKATREQMAQQVRAERAGMAGDPFLANAEPGVGKRVTIDEKGQIKPYEPYDETYLGKLSKNLEESSARLNADIYKNPVGKAVLDAMNRGLDMTQIGQWYGAAAAAGEVIAKSSGDLRKSMAASGAPALQDLSAVMDEKLLGSLKKLKEEFVKSTPGMVMSFVPDTLLKAGMTVDPDPRMTGEKRFWAGMETALNLLGSEMVIGAMKAGKGVAMLHQLEQVLDSGGSIGDDLVKQLEHQIEIPGVLGDLEKVPETRPKQRMSPEEIKSILGDEADSDFLSDYESKYLDMNPGATVQDAREAYAWSVKNKRESAQLSDATTKLAQDFKERRAEGAKGEPEKVEYPKSLHPYTGETVLGDVRMVDPDELFVNPDVQYKSGTNNASRTTNKFKDIDVYDVHQGGTLTAWERLDGRLEIAHGHHRAELAKRAERFIVPGQGMQDIEVPRQIPVRLLRESDGWDLNSVRLQSALDNLKNGDGDAFDAVQVLREMGETSPEALGKRGISLKGALGRNVEGMLDLSDDAMGFVRRREVNEAAAAGLGAAKIEKRLHAAAMKRLADRGGAQSYDQAMQFARIFEDNVKLNEAQEAAVKADAARRAEADAGGLDLFGDSEPALKPVVDTIDEQLDITTAAKSNVMGRYSELKKGLELNPMEGEHINAAARSAELEKLATGKKDLASRVYYIFEKDEPIKALARELALKVKNGEITTGQAGRELEKAVIERIKTATQGEIVVGRQLPKGDGSLPDAGGRGPDQRAEVAEAKPEPVAKVEAPKKVEEVDPFGDQAKPTEAEIEVSRAEVKAAKTEKTPPKEEPKPVEAPKEEPKNPERNLGVSDSKVDEKPKPVKVVDRASFEKGLREHFDLSDEEVAAVGAITEARAKGWAKDNKGKSPEDWYAKHWEGITTAGEEVSQVVLQKNKGAVRFKNDGRAVLVAMTKPDVTTVLHEVGHVFAEQLPESEIRMLEKLYGLNPGEWQIPISVVPEGRLKDWTAAKEKFARSFERYLYDGIVPHAKLKPVFEKLKDWFRNVYKVLKGSEIAIDVNPKLRNVFDRLLNEDGYWAKYDPTVDVKAGTDGTEILFKDTRYYLSTGEKQNWDRLVAAQSADVRRIEDALFKERNQTMKEVHRVELEDLEREHVRIREDWLANTQEFQRRVEKRLAEDADGRHPGFRLDDGGELVDEAPKVTYESGVKYHQEIPEVTRINPKKLVNGNPGEEVSQVSDDVARSMKFDEPIEATIFKGGEVIINDGHHRAAAATQLGLDWVPVRLKSVNATGETIQELVNDSAKFETMPFGHEPKARGDRKPETLYEQLEDIESQKSAPKSEAPVAGVQEFSKGDSYKAYAKRVRNEMTVEELRESLKFITENQKEVKAELSRMTIPQLKEITFSFYAKSKSDWVNSAYNSLLHLHNPSDTLTVAWGDTTEGVLKKVLDDATQETVDAYRESKKAAATAEAERIKKSLENPETVDEYKTFIRVKGKDALTPEQRATYEDLVATANRDSRKASDYVGGVQSEEAKNVELEIVKHYHSKREKDVFIVKMGDRVSAEAYQEMNRKAKQLGGWYSRPYQGSPGGFAFESEESAAKFVELQKGSVSRADEVAAVAEVKAEKRSSKLRTVAESLEAKANEVLNADRKTNTHKRADQARYAEESAQQDIAMAKTMKNLADAIEAGEAKHLENVSAGTHVETLEQMLRAGRHERIRKEGISYQSMDGKPFDLEDVAHVNVHPEHLPKYVFESAAEQLKGTRIGQRLQKRLDFRREYIEKMTKAEMKEIIEAYKELKKPGILKLEGNATNIDYMRVVASDLKGTKLGDKYARKIEVYEGDIPITTKEVEEIQSAYKKLGASPIRIEERLATRARLEAMNIKTPEELRAALREYLQFKEGAKAADPVKAAERALIGVKIPGYFPTPEKLAQRVIDEAGIEPGMIVLEPSAGKGSLAELARAAGGEVKAIEVNSRLRDILTSKEFPLVGDDFLQHSGEYDRIVMNPPFENGQDIDHVQHAFGQLTPGGRMVAIMSEGPFFRSDKKATAFREWLEQVGGVSEKLPEGSFKDSDNSTGVATRLVTIDKSERLMNQGAPTRDALYQKDWNPEAKAEVLGWIKTVLKENGGDGLGAVKYFTAQGLSEAEAVNLVLEAGGRVKKGLGLKKESEALDLFDDAADQGALFQSAKAQQDENGFYLKSARIIDQKMGGTMAPNELENMLRNNGVTQDELDWTGLGDLIRDSKGRLSKASVEKWIDDNSVRIEIEGKQNSNPEAMKELRRIEDELKVQEEIKSRAVKSGGVEKYIQAYEEASKRYDPFSSESPENGPVQVMLDALAGKYGKDAEDFLKAQRKVESLEQQRSELWGVRTGKFEAYTVGGRPDNYREVLIKGKRPLDVFDDDFIKQFEEIYAIEKSKLDSEFESLVKREHEFEHDEWVNKLNEIHDKQNDLIDTVQEMTQKYFAKSRQVKPGPAQHFNEQTIVHVRSSEREIGGRKSYFLEEVQSDRHQEARKSGGDAGAPFAKNWSEVAMRQSLRTAVEEGYDSLSWTEGNIHARRYNQLLADQVGRIEVGEVMRYEGEAPHRNVIVYDTQGKVQYDAMRTQSGTEELVGKELAERIWGNEKYHEIKDFNGAIGGEGFRQFYDRAIPSYMKKYVKKWGAEVKPTTMKVNGEDVKVWEVEITPEMRRSVMDEGQSLFQAADPVNDVDGARSPFADDLKAPDELKVDHSKKAIAENPVGFAKAKAWFDATKTKLGVNVDQFSSVLGSPMDRLRNIGEPGTEANLAGRQLAAEIEKIDNLSAADTVLQLDYLFEPMVKKHGKYWELNKDVQKQLEELAKAIDAGDASKIEDETVKEIYKRWTNVNGAFVRAGKERYVMVDSLVNDVLKPHDWAAANPLDDAAQYKAMQNEEFWKDQQVGWYDRDANGTARTLWGRIQKINEDSITLMSDEGLTYERGRYLRLSRSQAVDPKNYFPRSLDKDFMNQMADKQGPKYEAYLQTVRNYVLDNEPELAKRLEDMAEGVRRNAEAQVQKKVDQLTQSLFDIQGIGDAVTAGPVRLERVRLPFRLPDEFYNWNFGDVTRTHVQNSVRRLRMAEVWGHDGSSYAQSLSRLSNDSEQLKKYNDLIKQALGQSEPLDRAERKLSAMVAWEGAYQVVSKLSGLTSTVKQLNQMASTYSVLGFKAGQKAMNRAVLDLFQGRKEIMQVFRSGAIQSALLDAMAMRDYSKAARLVSDVGVTITGLKPVDAALRVHGAIAGRIAVEDLIKGLKIGPKGIVKDAKYRVLSDWFLYTDDDIAEMAAKKVLSYEQEVMAYHGGAKTQVRNRPSETPAALKNSPIWRVMTRFQMYNYGQTKILTYALHEARKGNPAPLLKMAATYTAMGWITGTLNDKIKAAWTNKKEGKRNDLADELQWSVLNSGMLGIFGRPLETAEALTQGDDEVTGAEYSRALQKGIVESPVPPALNFFVNMAGSASYAMKNNLGPLEALDDFARNEVVPYGRTSKRTDPDYNYIKRMRRDIKKQFTGVFSDSDTETFLEKFYQTPAPRWARPEYKEYDEALRLLVKPGEPGKSRSNVMEKLGPRPDPFGREKKPRIPVPSGRIQGLTPETLGITK